jgi:glycosyltransferase involved in cell wall biosynthesis
MLCCYEPPGFGGASSQSYDLLLKMRNGGIDASLVNLIDEQDRAFFEYTFGDRLGNPDGADGVYNTTMAGAFADPQPGLGATIERLSPDVIVAVGYIATVAVKRYQAGRPIIFFVVGGSLAQLMVLDGWATDAISLARFLHRAGRPPLVEERGERGAVEAANLIITNSASLYEQYIAFYPSWAGKIYPRVVWTAEWIAESTLRYASLAKPFGEREIDMLFIASSWDRRVKNYGLVRRLAREFPHATIHVVGDVVERIPRVHHHGFLASRTSLFELMGNTRTVVSPSLIDAAPGILFQASTLGCNVVASKNCGNWTICNPELLADPCDAGAFTKCIARSFKAKYQDNMAQFVQSGSYQDLIETIMVL